MNKKFEAFENMHPMDRRKFLKTLSLVLSAPLIPPAVRFACNEILMGEAYAQAVEVGQPSIFIEINFRDQWDFMCCFVPPGLATFPNLRRGFGPGVALFEAPNTLLQAPGNFYLTQAGRALQPHLDNIAVMELCELSVGDIHGHEAANCIRSPGRSTAGGPGRSAMYLLEGAQSGGGNMPHMSSTPTPAILHNYYQRQITPSLRRGIAYKGISRDIHTAYHFAADLQDAQIDRYQTTQSLISAFSNTAGPVGILQSHGAQITQLLKMVDANFAQRLYYNANAHQDHQKQVTATGTSMGGQRSFNLALTPEEINYWSSGVSEEGHRGPKAQIWEQVAYASKLVTAGLVRTVALEFDYVDIHGGRDESAMRATGTQTALPLARLIQSLKSANLWDRTIIAMYTTDGGRTPISDSYGSEGKNGVVLAGGRIRGGYYGDIRVESTSSDSHTFRYHMPDNVTGQPIPNGTTGNGMRTSGASIWKTVAKATGIPASVYNQFPDVRNAPELNFLLRG